MPATDRTDCAARRWQTGAPTRRWVGLAAAIGMLALTGCAAARLQASRALADAAVPYQASPAAPAFRLLVVGDSTALGTGASTPAASLPGWIGRHHPDWEIRNLGVNGARWADLPGQLAVAGSGYDAVLVMAGGNDVIRFTARGLLDQQVRQTLAQARRHADRVVVMPPGNVGHAPFFLPPLSWWMGVRSQALHAVVQAAAAEQGAAYVRLLRPRDEDPFVADAGRLHAADGLHPSDAGYGLWYEILAQQSAGAMPLRPAERAAAVDRPSDH